MQPNKRMSKSTALLLALGMFGTGAVGSIGYQVFAQTSPASYPAAISTEAIADQVDEVDSNLAEPLGGDGDGEMDDDTETNDVQPILPSGGISAAQAQVIAEKAYTGNGSVTKTELEDEDGVVVYGFEFTESDGNEVDVKINAQTGAVVTIEDDKTDSEVDDGEDGEIDD